MEDFDKLIEELNVERSFHEQQIAIIDSQIRSLLGYRPINTESVRKE